MKKFYIGLDVGTDSCGIAATDEDYTLYRYKGKDMWCSGLFNEAKPSEERRIQRTTRRRLERRRNRIKLLQGIFANEVSNKDNLFFLRLNNSMYWYDDKDDRLNNRFNLFDDDYTDIDYHKKYQTIFHLRKALCEGEKADIRLFYLAIHHIVKYRGHFLFDGQNFENIFDVKPALEEINAFYEKNLSTAGVVFDVNKIKLFEPIVFDTETGIKEKCAKAEELFDCETKQAKEVIKAIFGGKCEMSTLLGNDDYKSLSEYNKFSFKDAKFEEEIPLRKDEFGEDFGLVVSLKKVYDWAVLSKLLRGDISISNAMVKIYGKHEYDLHILKVFVKENYPDKYNEIFKDAHVADNYCAYAGIAKINGKKQYVKRCKGVNEFYAFLKKIIDEKKSELAQDSTYMYITQEMENGMFLPRILDADNGVFPQQLNKIELEKICANLAKQYPSFSVKDDSGLTLCDKIMSIFTFKIPYYVGPLNRPKDENVKCNAWIVKKTDEKILPWNFDDIVDKEKTAEKFIRRMTNKCTYLKGEDVLPKCSIIYSEFCVLNQINKLKINSVPISIELKQRIFEEFFKKEKKTDGQKIKGLVGQ